MYFCILYCIRVFFRQHLILKMLSIFFTGFFFPFFSFFIFHVFITRCMFLLLSYFILSTSSFFCPVCSLYKLFENCHRTYFSLFYFFSFLRAIFLFSSKFAPVITAPTTTVLIPRLHHSYLLFFMALSRLSTAACSMSRFYYRVTSANNTSITTSIS